MTQLSSINFRKTYLLGDAYESIKERSIRMLDKHLRYPGLLVFNDIDRSVTFSTERLIPVTSTNRPRIMLLFSNPHPHSVHQGMFLSPNTTGRENLFWSVMEDAGWLSFAEEKHDPKSLARTCLEANYRGQFEFIFCCYYAFPTDFPEDIKTIFGRGFFSQFIEVEAVDEFRKIIQETSAEAVVTFNKGIFNRVSKDQVDHYIERLMRGELIQSQVKDIGSFVPIFLTFPTGWRYHRLYRQFRKASLDTIRIAICSGLNTAKQEHDSTCR